MYVNNTECKFLLFKFRVLDVSGKIRLGLGGLMVTLFSANFHSDHRELEKKKVF